MIYLKVACRPMLLAARLFCDMVHPCYFQPHGENCRQKESREEAPEESQASSELTLSSKGQRRPARSRKQEEPQR